MSKTERKTEYILDIAEWRCGGDPWEENTCWAMGSGETALLNGEGFMCCLGQFACQVISEDDADATGHSFPYNLARALEKAYDLNFVEPDGMLDGSPMFQDTKLASDCAKINDDEYLTVFQKVQDLSERLAKDGITLLVKNAHLILTDEKAREDDED